MKNNLFRAAAEYYDLDLRPVVKDDIAFYTERAGMYPGDVLELACGTGRIMIPLAEAGYDVWGVDLSSQMLGKMEEKLNDLKPGVRDRIKYIHADMCDFHIDRKFSLIFIPFRSFQVLTEDSHQKACLESVKAHLDVNGRFIINVFKPYAVLDETWVRGENVNWETVDPRTGSLVRAADRRTRIDVKNQVIYPDLIYYFTGKDGTEEYITEHLSLKYYYESQIRDLLESCGFCIEEEMGYYDGRPIKDGGELIFVCRVN